MKSAMIHARIEPELKNEVEHILKKLGLNTTQAVELFYRQIALRKGLPFEVEIPNAVTQKTINEARKGINVGKLDMNSLKHVKDAKKA